MAAMHPRARWPVLAALVVGLVSGALFSYYGISKDGTDTYTVAAPAPRSESPRVTDLPMSDAIATLVDNGYRVVAVGRGKVTLQELGSRGHVLRIVGEHGSELRYCDSRFPECVPIGSNPR